MNRIIPLQKEDIPYAAEFIAQGQTTMISYIGWLEEQITDIAAS